MNATIRVSYDDLPTVEVLEHEEDTQGNVFTVLRPFSVCGITIPAGFCSDGASVPRLFWGVVFPNGDRRALCAALLHDFLYRTHPPAWTRSDADAAFYHTLRAGGIFFVRSLRAYLGVRLFGCLAWRNGAHHA